jgi:hypothetical protein
MKIPIKPTDIIVPEYNYGSTSTAFLYSLRLTPERFCPEPDDKDKSDSLVAIGIFGPRGSLKFRIRVNRNLLKNAIEHLPSR